MLLFEGSFDFLCEQIENTMKSKKTWNFSLNRSLSPLSHAETSQPVGCVPPGWYSIWVTWLEMIPHQTQNEEKLDRYSKQLDKLYENYVSLHISDVRKL